MNKNWKMITINKMMIIIKRRVRGKKIIDNNKFIFINFIYNMEEIHHLEDNLKRLNTAYKA